MKRIALLIAAAAGLASSGFGPAVADTVYMKNGTHIDGTIVVRTDSQIELRIGERTVKLQADEVQTTETNAKTGELDIAAVRADVQKRLAEIEAKTGLKAEDIRRIKELLGKLRSSSDREREEAFYALQELHKRADVIAYLGEQVKRFTPGLAVPVLEVLYKLDAKRGLEIARENAEMLAPETRGKSLDILSRSQEPDDLAYVVRGLVDPDHRVRIVATKALEARGEKRVTPLMLANLHEDNAYLQEASRGALGTLWQLDGTQAMKMTAAEWNEYWTLHESSVGNAFKVSQLTPLVDPMSEYVHE